MPPFATTSTTIRLALVLTVLIPMPLCAQTLTAREMLAQAQKQAVMPPEEIKKPGTTEIAKLEVGKADPVRPQSTKLEPPRVELAPPMPIIAPAAPEQPAPAASIQPAPQNRVTDSAPAMPVPDIAKPSPAPIVLQAAPPAAVSIVPAPVAIASPMPTPLAAAPTPAIQARASQPAAPHARVANTTYARGPASAIQTKNRHEHAARASSKAPREEQTVMRHPHESRGGSFNGVNAQMISQIMRRPEVQSLLAQYGAR